jgi:hypothetical protein
MPWCDIRMDALSNLLELGDPNLGPVQGRIQLLPQMWTNRLAGLPNVDGADVLDLFQRQSEGAQPADHLQAPEGGLVEEPVVAVAPPKPIDGQPPGRVRWRAR